MGSNIDAVGVDGCRGGWIAVFRDEGALRYAIHPTFDELMLAFADGSKVAVDIPIGLPDRPTPSRACDLAARKVLGPRRSSVFSPPSRLAARQPDVLAARQANLAEVGKSLSEQAWGIARKIAEVDQWLTAHPNDSDRVMEIHPEVCFWSLHAERPMQAPKKTREGQDERLRLLTDWEPEAAALCFRVLKEQKRSQVQRDDVLDALAAWVTVCGPSASLRSLPTVPQWDGAGLPMRMVYRSC